MLQVIAKFIAITKEEGMEEEKKTVVFWSTKSVAKKESFFVPCVIVCFHPNKSNYQLIKAKNMTKEVEDLFNLRIKLLKDTK